jgi:hypothetical protein
MTCADEQLELVEGPASLIRSMFTATPEASGYGIALARFLIVPSA